MVSGALLKQWNDILVYPGFQFSFEILELTKKKGFSWEVLAFHHKTANWPPL